MTRSERLVSGSGVPPPTMNVLVLNAGSSSQKCCVYTLTGETLPAHPPTPLWEAQLDGASLTVRVSGVVVRQETLPEASPGTAVPLLLETLWSGASQVLNGPDDVDVVGHRVVHGGLEYRRSTPITPVVKAAISRLSPLAPAHNPAALAGIEAAEAVFGSTPQVAVFDTAFHSTLPEEAAVYPGPYAWAEQGIRRYGFHGISHEYCAERAAELLGRPLSTLRVVTCHLGNGCSLAAVRDGRSVDTTMGFTPLEGLMMGTRSGSVDPGLLLYLLRQGHSADDLDRLLNRESGLKGLSGVSGDMREVAAATEENPRARLALDVYVHRIRFYIGAMLASLGGLDALVFTAGVGEHSARVRAEVCAAFAFLGLELADQERSLADRDVATPESAVRVLVVHAEENWAIARKCQQLVERADEKGAV